MRTYISQIVECRLAVFEGLLSAPVPLLERTQPVLCAFDCTMAAIKRSALAASLMALPLNLAPRITGLQDAYGWTRTGNTSSSDWATETALSVGKGGSVDTESVAFGAGAFGGWVLALGALGWPFDALP